MQAQRKQQDEVPVVIRDGEGNKHPLSEEIFGILQKNDLAKRDEKEPVMKYDFSDSVRVATASKEIVLAIAEEEQRQVNWLAFYTALSKSRAAVSLLRSPLLDNDEGETESLLDWTSKAMAKRIVGELGRQLDNYNQAWNTSPAKTIEAHFKIYPGIRLKISGLLDEKEIRQKIEELLTKNRWFNLLTISQQKEQVEKITTAVDLTMRNSDVVIKNWYHAQLRAEGDSFLLEITEVTIEGMLEEGKQFYGYSLLPKDLAREVWNEYRR